MLLSLIDAASVGRMKASARNVVENLILTEDAPLENTAAPSTEDAEKTRAAKKASFSEVIF